MPPKKPTSQVKFGKILAVGMAVALIWGVLLLVLAYYLYFKLGTVVTELIGDVNVKANLKVSVNEFGQQLVPYSTITDDIYFGAWVKGFAAAILLSAVLTILFAGLGIYSGLTHTKILLIVTVVMLIVSAFILLGIIGVVTDQQSTIQMDAKEQMTKLLRETYTVETANSGFVFAMNGIMIWFQCCGINGPGDFGNLTFDEQEVNKKTRMRLVFKIPPACCKDSLFNHAPTEKFAGYVKIKDCATSGTAVMSNVNDQGCYSKLVDEFQGPLFIFLGVVLTWDVLVLVLTILTILEIKPEGEIRPSPGKEAELERKAAEKEKEEREVVVKKFIPYAKISSFVHPDINRIKSTEIW